MYRNSTQKRSWHFDPETVCRLRHIANEKDCKRVILQQQVGTHNSRIGNGADINSDSSDDEIGILDDSMFSNTSFISYSPTPTKSLRRKRKRESKLSLSPFASLDTEDDNVTIISNYTGKNRNIEDENKKPSSAICSVEKQEVSPLNTQEEEMLRIFYEDQMHVICKSLSLCREVVSTAIIYFKRFYLNHSLMDYDPKNLMLTCLFLASKVEDAPISGIRLSDLTGFSAESIVFFEIPLIEGLKFHLTIYHPYKALVGFLYGTNHYEDSSIAKSVRERSLEILHWNYCHSDVCFLFHPSEIALASLSSAEDELNQPRYLEIQIRPKVGDTAANRLSIIVEDVQATFSAYKNKRESFLSQKKLLKLLNDRMKLCFNPQNEFDIQENTTSLQQQHELVSSNIDVGRAISCPIPLPMELSDDNNCDTGEVINGRFGLFGKQCKNGRL